MTAHGTHAAPSPADTGDVATLSALAKTAYAEKNMDAVVDLSSRILEADPENFVALRFMARIHTQRGEINLAEPIWRGFCMTARDKVEPALNLARFAYARGDWGGMAEFSDLAVRESGGRPDALRLAITARTRAKRPEQLPDMLFMLYATEPERAITALRTLTGPELAQAQAEALVRLDAKNSAEGALVALARECRKSWEVGARRADARKDDDVQASYLRAISIFDPSSQEAVNGLNALSRERLKYLRIAISKDDEAAIQHAESLAEFNPTSFEAFFAMARLTAENDPERSAYCFGVCARLKPSEVYYPFQQGLALVKSDRLGEAILAFRRVVEETDDRSDPIAIEAGRRIAGLRQTVLERAVDDARCGRLVDARTGYAAATGAVGLVGGGYSAITLVTFWAYVLMARIKIARRFIALRVQASLKRARIRYARVKQRLFNRAADPTVHRAVAPSTRR